MKVHKINIAGFKSIQHLDLPLEEINIFIGDNYSGKTNFIKIFELLKNTLSYRRMKKYVLNHGSIDKIMFGGLSTTKEIYGEIVLDDFLIKYSLSAAENHELSLNSFSINENNLLNPSFDTENQFNRIKDYFDKNFSIYHFNPKVDPSGIRKPCNIINCEILEEDGSNIPAVLNHLKNNNLTAYKLIVNQIQIAVPFFEDFCFSEDINNPSFIHLQWMQKNINFKLNINDMSDGILRLICLITLILYPNRPDIIIIEEPELGLSPHLQEFLAFLIKKTSKDNIQFIFSTHSGCFLNFFQPENIIFVQLVNNTSIFSRLNSSNLKNLLSEYNIGEIFENHLL